MKEKIKEAFLSGQLKVQAVDPNTGEVGVFVVSDILKHKTPHKRIISVTLEDGRNVQATEDHSLFLWENGTIQAVETSSLEVGKFLAVVEDGEVKGVPIQRIEEVESEEYTFDLSVPGPENFVLANGILAHNSYSIGGISLDIEKSSKYQGLKDNAENQFEKAIEAKNRTVKFMRGLQQPRFGIGIRSAFGPHVGSSILSPRAFLVFSAIPFASKFLELLSFGSSYLA